MTIITDPTLDDDTTSNELAIISVSTTDERLADELWNLGTQFKQHADSISSASLTMICDGR